MLAAFRAASQQAGGEMETPSGASDTAVVDGDAAVVVQAPVPRSTASSVDVTVETQGQPVSDLAALTDSAMLAGDESGTGGTGLLADPDASVEVRPADVADARLDTRVDGVAASAGGGTPTVLASTGVDAPTPARVVNAATLPADIAETVQAAVIRGDSEVRLVLNPPELGHVEVRIASHEGGLRISLEAAQSGARDLMERSLPALQQALEARDLRVERLNVQATDTGRGSLDTSAGGPQSGGSDANSGDGGPEWSAVASFGAGAEAVTAGPSQSQTADGRLDVMA
jgi:flagellar hook-length control protein FliK